MIKRTTFIYSLIFLLIFLISYYTMYDVRLSGDEGTYAGLSNQLYNYLFTERNSIDLVRQGWFPPGICIILLPLQIIFSGDVPLSAYRLYMLLFNLGILALISRQIKISLPKNPYLPCLFLAVLFINPYYLVFLSTLWTELFALHVFILLLLYISNAKKEITLGTILFAGVISFALMMIRGIYLVAPIFIILAIILSKKNNRKLTCFPYFKSILAIILSFCVLITLTLPWSLAVTEKYGSRFFLNNSEMSKIVWLGSTQYRQQVNKQVPKTNVFNQTHLFIQYNAQNNKVPFVKQAHLEVQKAIPSKSTDYVKKRIHNNIVNFLAVKNATGFLNRFYGLKCEISNSFICSHKIKDALFRFQNIIWKVLLAIGIILFVIPFSSRSNHFIFEFVFKGVVALVMIHPLIVLAHGRYYVQLIPLIALGIIFADYKSLSLKKIRQKEITMLYLGNIIAILFAMLVTFVYFTGTNPLI